MKEYSVVLNRKAQKEFSTSGDFPFAQIVNSITDVEILRVWPTGLGALVKMTDQQFNKISESNYFVVTPNFEVDPF